MPLSAEEMELIGIQTGLLNDAAAAGRTGQDLNSLLMPILLEEAGYSLTRASEDLLNPEYQRLQGRSSELFTRMHDNLGQYFNFNEGGEVTLSGAGRMSRRAREFQALAEEYNQVRTQLAGTQEYSHRAGDIIGLERILDPSDALREENELLLLERQNAALRGELPVNPALLSSLDEQEEELRAGLLRNLGTGYETSTPGIEALAEFSQRREAILESARRDDMAGAGTLANDMGSFLQGITASRMAQGSGIVGNQFGAASNLAQIVQGFSSPLQALLGSRELDLRRYEIDEYPSAVEMGIAQMFGSAMGAGMARCDRRLKQNVHPAGTLPSGVKLYVFEYIDEPGVLRVGPMADELEETHPHLVHTGEDGYKYVDLRGL